MTFQFLKHQWLQFKRSASFERELGITIFIWVMSTFALFSLISLAFALPQVIYKIPGITDPVWFINQALIYYFFSELLLRYFLQKVPALDIQPYLNLPIKRKHVAWFLVGKSLVSPFSILSVLLVIPFTIEILIPKVGTVGGYLWLASIFCISLSLHFFNILFKKKFEEMPIVWALLILIAGGNYALTYYIEFDLFKPLTYALQAILYNPVLIILPLLAAFGFAFFTINYFRNNLYLEELGDKEINQSESYTEKLGFLGRSTISNALLLQEIKMILRHKRTRSALIISLLFVGYGLLFFGRETGSKGILLLFGIFMSGSFAINYGQFFWSWNTNQLDFFFTKPLLLQTWLKSRYNLLVASSIITTMLTIPYVYFGWDILFMLLACSLYNIGINIPFMMRLSLWSPKPIDLNKSAMMNYQGTGAAQWVMGIPLIVAPFIIYLPFNIYFGHLSGLLAIAFVGLAGFTFRDFFLSQITKKVTRLKYQLIHNLTL
jgi:hypothetical protein